MTTESFDKRFVVTDQDAIDKLRYDLDNPVVIKGLGQLHKKCTLDPQSYTVTDEGLMTLRRKDNLKDYSDLQKKGSLR